MNFDEFLSRGVSRRSFLKVGGTTAGAAALGLTGLAGLRRVKAGEAPPEDKTVATACVMCPSECGLKVNVSGGVVSAIYGNPYVPYNNGAVCAKGSSGAQMVYSPYRIKYPMVRVGERGEGKFKRVSWDEAFDTIAKKLVEIKRTYGPESVIMDAGDVTDRDPYWRVFFAYGTPYCTEHGAICDTPRRHGPKLMFGGKRPEPEIMRPLLLRQPDGSLKNDYSYKTKLIIYVGWNPFTATRINYESRGTVEAKLNGARIVVVDPALSNTASKADLWLPIRPGTDPDLFAAMLRFILENDNQADPNHRYIDWSFKDWSVGWDEFEAAFRSWWGKTDPINGKSYFSLEWAADRCGFSQRQIADLAHEFGITKPAALVWGMNGTGHHYNGYTTSILGTVLDVITGNFDVPGGVVDTELTKSSKGGKATGKDFLKRKVKRVINGVEVEATQDELHMDHYGDWPAAWDDVVGDFPRRFQEGVTLRYGPFRGHRYPIKAFVIRTGNPLITGSETTTWQKALTAKDPNGQYKVELVVNIDTPFLETGMYADVVLPEASYLERMSLCDIYPSHPVLYMRDKVLPASLHESKTPFEIMIGLAKALAANGDPDIQAADFWGKYNSEEDFWNEAMAPAPSMKNVGTPLPYPQYPAGYKLVGTPDSLEAGRVTIDHKKKEVKGEPLTATWMREHNGVAVWPMAYLRYRDAGGGILGTSSKKIEFKFSRYDQYNKLIEKAGETPMALKAAGFDRYPPTFYWFETKWNPHTNPAYTKYKDEYPFQLISGRVHHAMSGTQMVDYLGRINAEGLWMPLNEDREFAEVSMGPTGAEPVGRKRRIPARTWSVGTIQMNAKDAAGLGLRSGDLVVIENPLGASVKGRIYATETIRPGVLRMALGTGGRFSPGLGKTAAFRETSANHNLLVDPTALSPIMGMPAYVDMVVKVRKA
ncbi:MAG: molybdopterin-dependent oxidoreductase [Chloroflexi bacterium]|nr:molybdopterin-dependent oxidoreductase [Chloroflexota bacterium]